MSDDNFDKLNERRLIENEKILRKANKTKGVVMSKFLALNESDEDTSVKFRCECSDIGCGESISLSAETYEGIHSRNDRFVTCLGHNSENIERVVSSDKDYLIVEKFALSPT